MKTNRDQEPKIIMQAQKPIRHQRQVIWQIWLPLVATILLVISAAVLIIVLPAEGRTSINQFANFSTILVILPVLGAVIMVLGIIGSLIYLVSLLMNVLPGIGSKAQTIAENIVRLVKIAADGITKPMIWVNSRFASLRKIFEILTRKRN